jgi:RNA polymerase sigma factor (sigma-70 family)
MLKRSVSRLSLRQLEDLFQTGIAGNVSDGELLDRFLRSGDPVGEAAFTALVERHGPMVFRVCRQALGDHHAAQDAAQATFLVLARHAGTICKRASVSSWLFGVARRAAAHIRMEEARRRLYESRFAERSSALISAGEEIPDVDPYPELYTEIERLPEKYRIPIVLCYFEGLTHEQAASRLRWPLGTVKIRLSRARERLRLRLEKSGRPSLLLLPAHAIQTGSLSALSESTVRRIARAGGRCAATNAGGELVSRTVLKVAHGVMKSMLLHKLKLAGAVLPCLFVLGFGALVAGQHATRKGAEGQARAAIAESDDSRSTVRLHGVTEIAPENLFRISPPLDCRVERVLVNLGQRVKKGDPLVELFSAELAEAKSNYEAAADQWLRDQEALEKASKRVKEDARHSLKEPIEISEYMNRSRLKMRRAKVKLLAYGLTEQEIENASTEDGAQKARMILRLRGEGVVIQRSAVPGNFYESSDTLMVVARDDRLWVTASASEQDLPSIRVGQDLTISFPFGDRHLKARVESIGPQVDHETHTVKIRTTIPNADHALKPGLFVRMAIETDARRDRNDERPTAGEQAIDPTMQNRLNGLERKVDLLLGEKEERLSHSKILERLDALERKVDRLLDGRKTAPP